MCKKYKVTKEHKQKIIQAGTEEQPYYTNSSQLPVNFTDDVFEALDLQDDLQCKYTRRNSISCLYERSTSGYYIL